AGRAVVTLRPAGTGRAGRARGARAGRPGRAGVALGTLRAGRTRQPRCAGLTLLVPGDHVVAPQAARRRARIHLHVVKGADRVVQAALERVAGRATRREGGGSAAARDDRYGRTGNDRAAWDPRKI